MEHREGLAPRLARTISRATRDAGITQQNIADDLGVSINTISRRFTGRSPFLITEVEVIAERLHVPLLDLLAEAEQAAA